MARPAGDLLLYVGPVLEHAVPVPQRVKGQVSDAKKPRAWDDLPPWLQQLMLDWQEERSTLRTDLYLLEELGSPEAMQRAWSAVERELEPLLRPYELGAHAARETTTSRVFQLRRTGP
jgi:hypothetical protein